MSRIIQPMVSRKGRVILLSLATLWLAAAMALSAAPDPAAAVPTTSAGLPDISSSAAVVQRIDKIDGAESMLYFPRVFAPSPDSVFVTDLDSGRAVLLNPQAGFAPQTVYGYGKGAGPGEMLLPYAVDVDSRGNVFVSDTRGHRISKFAPDGTFIKSVATTAVGALVVDAQDRLIAYPAGGDALLQRFSNDLEEDGRFLEKTDLQHTAALGVLLDMGPDGRLYLLDENSLAVWVYDENFEQIDSWSLDAPALRENVALRLERRRQRAFEGSEVRINGVQSMSLDPSGRYLVMAYMMEPSDDLRFSRVVWYTVDGRLLHMEERSEVIWSTSVIAGERHVEASSESIEIWQRGPSRARGDN